MAKGDFIYAGPNVDTYMPKDFQKGQLGVDKVAGLTLLFLFVTIKLEKKDVKTPAAQAGEHEDDEKPATETKEKGAKDQEKGDSKPTCVCKAHITDYSLQADVFVDKDVPAGDKQLGVVIHELYHLLHHKKDWDDHKKELDTLLDGHEYACKDDCKSEIAQDIFAWLVNTFYSDQAKEEESTKHSEEALEHEISTGKPEKKLLDGVFGSDRMKENAKDAKADKALPLAGRFSSRVIPTWDGSCAEK